MGIFNTPKYEIFSEYEVTIVMRDRIMGGIPQNPRVIEGWIAKKMGIDDQTEIKAQMLEQFIAMGIRLDSTVTSYEQVMSAADVVALKNNTNGFLVVPEPPDGMSMADFDDLAQAPGPYLEDRCIKAGLRESVAIMFNNQRISGTRKGVRSYFVERVFPWPSKVHMGKPDVDGVHLFIGHVNGPKGPQSTLTHHQFVQDGVLKFKLKVLYDDVTPDIWAVTWNHFQENGLGALRSQSFGRFDIEQFDLVGRHRANRKVAGVTSGGDEEEVTYAESFETGETLDAERVTIIANGELADGTKIGDVEEQQSRVVVPVG